MFRFALLLGLLVNIQAICLDKMIVKDTMMRDNLRRSSRNVLSGFNWKNRLINNQQGHEQFRNELDDSYEFMLHAIRSKDGVEVWRVCQKNTPNPYGRVSNTMIDGYVININDPTWFDVFHWKNGFQVYGTSLDKLKTAYHKEMVRIDKNNRKEFPIWTSLVDLMYLSFKALFLYTVFKMFMGYFS